MPPPKVCPDGTILSYPNQNKPCPAIPGVAQPGATNATVTGAVAGIASTIGNVVGGGFGGGSGPTASSGIQRMALGGQTGQAAAAGGPRWNLWAAYSHVDVGYSFQPLQSGGSAKIFLGGVDYSFGDMILGVAVTDERTRISTAYNGGSINGNGNSIAPYFGWRLTPRWVLDASLGFGDTKLNSTDNSIAGGITGSNKVERTMATLGLAYNAPMGNWLLTGKGSLLSVENKFSAFTFTNGTFVAGSTARTTQARLYGQGAYNAGNVTPFVGLAYIYDIDRPTQGAIGGQTAANDRDAWQARLGVSFRSGGALYGGISLSSDFGRSQVKNDQILFNLGVRF